MSLIPLTDDDHICPAVITYNTKERLSGVISRWRPCLFLKYSSASSLVLHCNEIIFLFVLNLIQNFVFLNNRSNLHVYSTIQSYSWIILAIGIWNDFSPLKRKLQKIWLCQMISSKYLLRKTVRLKGTLFSDWCGLTRAVDFYCRNIFPLTIWRTFHQTDRSDPNEHSMTTTLSG